MFLKPKWIQISFVKICKTYGQIRTGLTSNPYIPVKTELVFSHLLNVVFFKTFLSNSQNQNSHQMERE